METSRVKEIDEIIIKQELTKNRIPVKIGCVVIAYIILFIALTKVEIFSKIASVFILLFMGFGLIVSIARILVGNMANARHKVIQYALQESTGANWIHRSGGEAGIRSFFSKERRLFPFLRSVATEYTLNGQYKNFLITITSLSLWKHRAKDPSHYEFNGLIFCFLHMKEMYGDVIITNAKFKSNFRIPPQFKRRVDIESDDIKIYTKKQDVDYGQIEKLREIFYAIFHLDTEKRNILIKTDSSNFFIAIDGMGLFLDDIYIVNQKTDTATLIKDAEEAVAYIRRISDIVS